MALTKIQTEQIADDAVGSAHIADNIALGGSPTTTTQSASDNSTKVATTAYVDTAYANLVDSSPATLNTLNELAAALGDDANFSTTVTNSIATKLPLAGGTMTGNLIVNAIVDADNFKINNAQGSDGQVLTSTGSGVAWETPSSPITALNNATANELVTVGSTTTELDAESGLTYNGSALTVTGTITCDGLTTGNNDDVSIGGILKGSDSTFQILTSTSDGSDSSRVRINGGGSTGSSRGAQLELQGNEHTFAGEALLSAGDVNTAYVGISAPHSSGYITLGTAGTERMRIDSNGDLFLGQTSQTGYVFAQKLVVGDGDANDGITIQSGSTHQGNLAFNNADGTTAHGRISYQHNSNYMAFMTNNAEKMRILSGGGITFNGDTAAANALDDYEEGTWTPTVGGNTGQGSTSSGTIAGKYIKIGKLVTASFSIAAVTISNASGHLKIGGFPFNNDGTNDREANGVMRTYGVDLEPFSSHGSPTPAVNNDTNTAFVLQSKDNAAWAVVQVDNGSGQYFEGTITYIAT